jgi:hypothetical protein
MEKSTPVSGVVTTKSLRYRKKEIEYLEERLKRLRKINEMVEIKRRKMIDIKKTKEINKKPGLKYATFYSAEPAKQEEAKEKANQIRSIPYTAKF